MTEEADFLRSKNSQTLRLTEKASSRKKFTSSDRAKDLCEAMDHFPALISALPAGARGEDAAKRWRA